MVGRSACAALAALMSPLVGCLLTTSLDDLESGAGGMSGSGASASSTTATTGGAAGSSSSTSSGGGTAMITVLADQQEAPDAIAVDSEYVYFGTKDGFIKRVPIAGGPAGIVASGHYSVKSIALSDQFMWWSVYNAPPIGAIWRAKKSGADAQPLAPDQNLATEVVLWGTQIYWSTTGTGGQIKRADAVIGDSVEVVENSEAFFFTIHDDVLFFTMNYTAPGATGQVWAVELNPPNTRVAIAQGVFRPAAIAADGMQVVWAQEGDGFIVSASPPSYSQSTVTMGVAPFDVALDAGNIYFTDPGAGRVMKIMNGGETVLAEDRGSPRNIAVDATSVYWTDNETGMVLKAAK